MPKNKKDIVNGRVELNNGFSALLDDTENISDIDDNTYIEP